eukprot:gene34349-44370_t
MSAFGSEIESALSIQINEDGVKEFLSNLHWPLGLQQELLRSLKSIPIRFFIYDDSGSMGSTDGHKVVKCSRWVELSESMKFHVGLSRAASAPSEIRTLNSAPPLLIGTDNDDEDENRDKLGRFFSSSPNGLTPLCRHIKDVISKIQLIAPELASKGQKACVIIVTDGEASDGNLLETMKPLDDLPVFIVVKLCTDEEAVVKYWNSIDEQLEVSIDVLDDFVGESVEVAKVNGWLAYGPPLHLLREFGTTCRDFDMIDEHYGGTPVDYPDPQSDWAEFEAVLADKNDNPAVYPVSVRDPNEHPIRTRPWVDVAEVARVLEI